MLQCRTCHKPLAELGCVCPYCGSKTEIHTGAENAQASPETLQKQTDAVRHVQRGMQFLLKERYAEAGQEFRTAIRLNPSHAAAYGQLGSLLLKQGRAKEALTWFEKALQIDPALEGISEALQQTKALAGVAPATQQVKAQRQKSTQIRQKAARNFLPKLGKILCNFIRCE